MDKGKCIIKNYSYLAKRLFALILLLSIVLVLFSQNVIAIYEQCVCDKDLNYSTMDCCNTDDDCYTDECKSEYITAESICHFCEAFIKNQSLSNGIIIVCNGAFAENSLHFVKCIIVQSFRVSLTNLIENNTRMNN